MQPEDAALSTFREHFEAPRVVSDATIDYFYETVSYENRISVSAAALVLWEIFGGLFLGLTVQNWWGLGLWIGGMTILPILAWVASRYFEKQILAGQIRDCQILAAEIVSCEAASAGEIITVDCQLAINFKGINSIQTCSLSVRRADFGTWHSGQRLVTLYDPSEKKIIGVVGKTGLDAALPLTLPDVGKALALSAGVAPITIPWGQISTGEESKLCSEEEKMRAMDALKEAFSKDKIDSRLLSERIDLILKAETSQQVANALAIHVSRL